MNIVLTGMRGSGKSHYGQLLAKSLNWKSIDTDTLVEKKSATSIPAIVEKFGWDHFRKLEKEAVKEVSTLDEHVISTGGGTIIDKENEQLLKQNGKIIFLYRTPENCANFILKNTKTESRPSLTNRKIENADELKAELEELWATREKRYRESADLIIDTNKEIEPEEILEKLQEI